MNADKITKRSLYSWVFGPNLKLQLLLLAVIVVTVGARVFPLEMQKRVINEAIALKDVNSLVLYCGLYMGAVLLAGILKYFINFLQGFIGQRTLKTIRARLFEHIMTLPMSFFRRMSPGHVSTSLVQELAPVGDFIGSAVAIPVVNILTFFAMAGYMFHLNPLLAGISILIYPVDIAILPLLQKRFNKVNRRKIRRMRDMNAMVAESVTGIHEVHAHGGLPLESKKFSEHIRELFTTNIKFTIYKFGIKFTNNFFQSLGPFMLFLVGGYLAIKGRFDLGALVAFLSAYEKLYDPWKELIEFYQQFQDSKVRYRQVMETYNVDPEHALAPTGRDPYVLDGALHVRNTSFVVGGNIRLLDGVSLDLAHGEHMALVGFSGSGKSTLALVIGQLYTHSQGQVLLGGRNVSDLSRRDMILNVGMVPQHPFIFGGTVRENLLYACDAARLQGGECSGSTQAPDLDRIIMVVQQVGLFVDVLRFGMRARLDPDSDPEMAQCILAARKRFKSQFRDELEHDVDFFEDSGFSSYVPLALNIMGSAPLDPEFAEEKLPSLPFFQNFLVDAELDTPLFELGKRIAERAVDILRHVDDSELFEDSPVSQEEFPELVNLVDRLEKDGKTAVSRADRNRLIALALSYAPGKQGLVPLPPEVADKCVAARERFYAVARTHAPGKFEFYRENRFLRSRNVLENILYGKIQSDSASAEDRLNQLLIQLLIEENILERVVAMGLEFDVGSMGDRLSGGQKQKIALARAFLKAPALLILDEATSALDNASQTRIQNLLERRWKGKASVVSVVHRLDTLPGYDKIAVLKAGRIIEQGPYDELMRKKGALYELVHGRR